MTETLCRSGCELGEAPVWHEERRCCFWVDVEDKTLYEYDWDQQSVRKYHLEYRISLVIPLTKNELILALQGGVAKFDLLTSTLNWISVLGDTDWRQFRCNDGGIDPRGRLWISTMSITHDKGAGALYRLDPTGQPHRMMTEISIPNGIVWSPDKTKMYFTDSVKAEIYVCSFDSELNMMTAKNRVIRIAPQLGLPDGMAADEEGMLWIALWGGSGVGRFNPDTGKMIDFIGLPVPHVTSCCFAGDDLDHLVITTAKAEMTAVSLRESPESGHVFIVKTKVKGLKCHQPDL